MSMRTRFAAFLRLLKTFGRSEDGMTLPLLAMSMVVITGMIGLAIDTARLQLVQSKLQFSLDAAGLAAASTVSTAALQSEVAKYLNTNFNGYMGAHLEGTTAVTDDSNTVITLTATATLPATFMHAVGVDTLTVHANSEISRSVSGLELVLVLDNTGSMSGSAGGGGSKLNALKSASNTLINTLYHGTSVAPDNMYIGIVPFSQAVNIGTSHGEWMDTAYNNANYSDWGPGHSWGGCVDARLNDEDVTDTPPSVSDVDSLFRQYYWTSDNLNPTQPNGGNNKWKFPQFTKCTANWNRCKPGHGCTFESPTCSTSNGWSCTALAPTCTTVTTCNASTGITCTALGTFAYSSPLNTTNKGPNLNCPQEVTPMTDSKTTLTTAINAMAARGNTVIPQGLQWGWHMLSPKWRGMWGGSMGSTLPMDYNSHGMNKAIVLLTDGVNTIDNSSHSNYWFLRDGRLGTTDSDDAVEELNSRTAELCTAIKAKGVYIYTIMLGTETSPATIDMLTNCATAPNYFFNSPTTSQLQTVFSAIGDSLSNLRVSK